MIFADIFALLIAPLAYLFCWLFGCGPFKPRMEIDVSRMVIDQWGQVQVKEDA